MHPGYYLPEDRARRIKNILESKDKFSIDDMKQMLLDVKSLNAPEMVKAIVEELKTVELSSEESDALNRLEKWDGTYEGQMVEPTIFIKLLYHILHEGMSDELKELFDSFNGTHLMKRSLQPLIANNESKWWDDISTTEVEGRKEIFKKAFITTISELNTQFGTDINQWMWKKAHILEHPHSLGTVATLRSFFNVGPFGVSGSTEVINNLQFKMSGDGIYEILAGPSQRRIVNFANLASDSWNILPTGQSGNPLSIHYKDQAEMYVKGEYRRQLMKKEEVEASARYRVAFQPK